MEREWDLYIKVQYGKGEEKAIQKPWMYDGQTIERY
jgi:hypothetical protein